MKKILLVGVVLLLSGWVHAQTSFIEYRGRDLGTPLREGARSRKIQLPDASIDHIEVRWRAKRGQLAQGWLFLDGSEYDYSRDVEDQWYVEVWENIPSGYRPKYLEFGVQRDLDDDSELQVDIDWLRIYN